MGVFLGSSWFARCRRQLAADASRGSRDDKNNPLCSERTATHEPPSRTASCEVYWYTAELFVHQYAHPFFGVLVCVPRTILLFFFVASFFFVLFFVFGCFSFVLFLVALSSLVLRWMGDVRLMPFISFFCSTRGARELRGMA